MPSWVYFAAEVPRHSPAKIIGIKFCIQNGDVWAMQGNARYKCVHGVVGAILSHVQKDCVSCKVTATLRLGLVKLQKYALQSCKLFVAFV